MGADDPLKQLVRILQRADEVQHHDKRVAYYCRLYAMEEGLKVPAKERSKDMNALLLSIMNQLEKDKKELQLSPDDNLHMEGFAQSVFARADKQDRAGRADLSTAKTFYAAGIFIEVLRQFGDLQPDLEEKQRYAFFKAADIRKALNAGRRPTAGPPGGDPLEGGPSVPAPGGPPSPTEPSDGAEPGVASAPSQGPPLLPQAPPASYHQIPPTDPPAASHAPPPFPPQRQHSAYGPGGGGIPDDRGLSPFPPAPGPGHLAAPSQPRQSSAPDAFPGFEPPPHQGASPGRPLPREPPPPLDPEQPPHPWPAGGSGGGDGQAPPPGAFPGGDGGFRASGPYPESYSNTPTFSPSPPLHPHDAASFSNPLLPGPASAPSLSPPPPPSLQSGPAAPSSAGSRTDGGPLQRATSSPSPIGLSGGLTFPLAAAADGVSGRGGPVSSGGGAGYAPPPERCAEAHKAARFAVSALAFDDVPAAIAFLQQALELLTSPRAMGS